MNAISEDLDYILSRTESVWTELAGKRIFITGATGFFGCWLLESIFWANQKLDSSIQVTALSRSASKFAAKHPRLAKDPALSILEGDVRDFTFPDGEFPFVIHAAADASASLNRESPLLMLDTITRGTQHVLEFCEHAATRKYLYVSSGAVYGKQPAEITHITEDYLGAPDVTNPLSAYGEGKRMAELQSVTLAQAHGFEATIARCFAFVGPYMDFDGSFAICNFIRDAVKEKLIEVQSPETVRSYLYAADLVIYLMLLLTKGKNGEAYNLGSGEAYNMAALAEMVGKVVGNDCRVEVNQDESQPFVSGSIYVPNVNKIESLHTFGEGIGLNEAVAKSVQWFDQTQAKTIEGM